MAVELSGGEYWESRIGKLQNQFKQRYDEAKKKLKNSTKFQQNLFDGLRFHINGLLEVGFETAVQMIVEHGGEYDFYPTQKTDIVLAESLSNSKKNSYAENLKKVVSVDF